MWEDKITSRTPREDFVLAPIRVTCGDRCPQEGHRARLDSPGDYDASQRAQTRVWALHAVIIIRGTTNELVSHPDVVDVLQMLADFDNCYDRHYVDSNTFHQLVRIRTQLARYVARRLNAMKSMREVLKWADGFREGARFARERQGQFQIRQCY